MPAQPSSSAVAVTATFQDCSYSVSASWWGETCQLVPCPSLPARIVVVVSANEMEIENGRSSCRSCFDCRYGHVREMKLCELELCHLTVAANESGSRNGRDVVEVSVSRMGSDADRLHLCGVVSEIESWSGGASLVVSANRYRCGSRFCRDDEVGNVTGTGYQSTGGYASAVETESQSTI